MLADWCATAQAEAHVVAGAPAEAIELSAAIAADRGGLSGARASVVLARAWLALGEPGTALQLLEPLRQSALPYLVEAVDARVLAAVALGRRHRTTAALEAITEAIELAEPETLIAPFVRAGSAVTEMIVQYRHVTGVRHDFADVIQHAITPQPVPEPALPNHAVEQLTDRETLVLRYLPTMLKSSEIGADLYLSVNTVKSHLRAIYRKLDVTNRRDAVERARALNLI
ncbi:MAG TPA: LuxR C-terminal-related transcriptional regulator [Nakamurella sp.]